MEKTNNQESATEEKQVITYSVTQAQIAALTEKFKDVPEDLSVKENYALVKKAISSVKPLRGQVEKRRKELKADALAWGKKVDAAAKAITTSLLEIEAPHAKAKKEYDTKIEIEKREKALAEEKRVDGIAERIAGIKVLVESNISSPSSVIQVAIDSIEDDLAEDWAQEFKGKADLVCMETSAKLEELRDMKLQQENAEAEKEKADAERKKAEEVARIKREKEVEADRTKLAKERAAMEAEKEKADAEQKKKDEEAEAERAKLAAEVEALKKEKEESEKPAPETPEQSQKPKETAGYSDDYKDTGNSLLRFVEEKAVAKALLDAIIKGDIPNVKFTGEV